MAAELQMVPFAGNHIEAVRGEDGEPWVVLKRLCQNLGIDPDSQRTKLASLPWAGTVIITVPSPGGPQETFCLNLDTLLMWLATIHPSKVAEAARPALVLYQKECARVLRAHFFGSPGGPAPGERFLVAELRRDMGDLRAEVSALRAKLDAQPKSEPELVTTIEAARKLGISERTFWRRVTDAGEEVLDMRQGRHWPWPALRDRVFPGLSYSDGALVTAKVSQQQADAMLKATVSLLILHPQGLSRNAISRELRKRGFKRRTAFWLAFLKDLVVRGLVVRKGDGRETVYTLPPAEPTVQ